VSLVVLFGTFFVLLWRECPSFLHGARIRGLLVCGGGIRHGHPHQMVAGVDTAIAIPFFFWRAS
jgi:hypothetical protein